MENIISIQSVIHKKKKKSIQNKKNINTLNSQDEHIRKYHSLSRPKNNPIHEEIPKIRKINSQDKLNIKKAKTITQKTLKKLGDLNKYTSSYSLKELQNDKYDTSPKGEGISITKVSCIDLETVSLHKNIESSNRIRKPNYLMKSAFIKDMKTLTPTNRPIENKLCPIYDFYSWKDSN